MNLPELLKTTTVSELDEAFLVLEKRVYAFPGKKGTYKIAGLMSDEGELIFQFVDNVLEVDTFCIASQDLPAIVKQDLLTALKLTV